MTPNWELLTVVLGFPRPETIRHVERLRSKFQPLAFTEAECSRQGHIEGPGCWTLNTVATDIACRSHSRDGESRLVEIAGRRSRGLVMKRVAGDLVCALAVDAGQRSVAAGEYIERGAIRITGAIGG